METKNKYYLPLQSHAEVLTAGFCLMFHFCWTSLASLCCFSWYCLHSKINHLPTHTQTPSLRSVRMEVWAKGPAVIWEHSVKLLGKLHPEPYPHPNTISEAQGARSLHQTTYSYPGTLTEPLWGLGSCTQGSTHTQKPSLWPSGTLSLCPVTPNHLGTLDEFCKDCEAALSDWRKPRNTQWGLWELWCS